MSYLRFEDQADGVHVFFDDVTRGASSTATSSTRRISPPSIGRVHLIRFSIDFKNGPAQDTVKIYIDGVLEITGTTWEDYYRYDSEQTPQGNKVPTVDKVLFRESGTADSTHSGNGFLIDRVSLKSSGGPKKKS